MSQKSGSSELESQIYDTINELDSYDLGYDLSIAEQRMKRKASSPPDEENEPRSNKEIRRGRMNPRTKPRMSEIQPNQIPLSEIPLPPQSMPSTSSGEACKKPVKRREPRVPSEPMDSGTESDQSSIIGKERRGIDNLGEESEGDSTASDQGNNDPKNLTLLQYEISLEMKDFIKSGVSTPPAELKKELDRWYDDCWDNLVDPPASLTAKSFAWAIPPSATNSQAMAAYQRASNNLAMAQLRRNPRLTLKSTPGNQAMFPILQQEMPSYPPCPDETSQFGEITQLLKTLVEKLSDCLLVLQRDIDRQAAASRAVITDSVHSHKQVAQNAIEEMKQLLAHTKSITTPVSTLAEASKGTSTTELNRQAQTSSAQTKSMAPPPSQPGPVIVPFRRKKK